MSYCKAFIVFLAVLPAFQQENDVQKQVESWAKRLSVSSDIKAFQTEWKKSEKLLKDCEGCTDEVKDKVKELAKDAVRGFIERYLAKIVPKSFFENLIKRQDELDSARKEALRIINDSSIYLPESKGGFGDKNPGQAKVNEAVKKVQKIWASQSPEFPKLLNIEKEINNLKNLAELLKDIADDSEKKVSDWIDELSKKAGLKEEFKERILLEFNIKVDEANEKLKGDKDVQSPAFEHMKILNDYRAMLGLPKMYIDVRICRAARKHSEAMDKAGKLWHDGPDGTLSSRGKAEGFSGIIGECCTMAKSAQDAFDSLYNASDHHRIMVIRQCNVFGVGMGGKAWTQDYGVDRDKPTYSSKPDKKPPKRPKKED